MYAINKKITSKYALTIGFVSALSFFAIAEEGETDSPEVGAQGANSEMIDKPTSTNMLVEKEKAWHSDLAKATQEREQVWLNIQYPNNSAQQKALALKIKAKTPETEGAALIIPDTQQHADWPGLVHQLRHSLPYAGWYSLSINTPWPDLEEPPERQSEAKSIESYKASLAITKATALGSRAQRQAEQEPSASTEAPLDDSSAEPAEENEEIPVEQDGDVDINLTETNPSDQNRASYEERLMAHIEAGMANLQQEGFQNIVVIAFGKSASVTVDYVKKINAEIAETGFSLVMVEPRLTPVINENFGEEIGKSFPAPILDIFRPSDLNQKEGARSRKVSATVGGFTNYHQLRLSAPPGTGSENFLTKRLGDWLNRYAPGQTKNR